MNTEHLDLYITDDFIYNKEESKIQESKILWRFQDHIELWREQGHKYSLNFYQFRKDQNMKGIISTDKQLLRHIPSETTTCHVVSQSKKIVSILYLL